MHLYLLNGGNNLTCTWSSPRETIIIISSTSITAQALVIVLITACQSADYPHGLMAHTSLISSGSFSEISSFMPGLKSLMQIATQLRV